MRRRVARRRKMDNKENVSYKELYLLCSRLTDVFTRAYPARTAGITRLQSKVLYMLDQYGDLTMGELAGRLKAHNSNLTPVVDQLYSEGYVTRISSENDRRLVEIAITEKGRVLSRELSEKMDDYIRNLPEQEHREIREALLKCAEML